MTVLKISNYKDLYGKLYKRDWMAKVAWDQAPHWGDERCSYPVFCLFAPLRSLVPGYGKNRFSHINASNFRPPLQSVLHIRLKMLRLPNFNTLFQAVLTKLYCFRVYRKLITWWSQWKRLLKDLGRRRYGSQPQETGHHGTADREQYMPCFVRLA